MKFSLRLSNILKELEFDGNVNYLMSENGLYSTNSKMVDLFIAFVFLTSAPLIQSSPRITWAISMLN